MLRLNAQLKTIVLECKPKKRSKACCRSQEGKRGVCRGAAQQTARGWFSFLWTPKEVEGRE